MSTVVDAEAPERAVTRAMGSGPRVLARVTDRLRALKTVEHPGVLVPSSVGVVEGEQVVVTAPWIDGVDLAELESRRGPLSAAECVWLGMKVADALGALHAKGIAHGDIAPANVVLTGGDVMLVDTVSGCLDDDRGTVGFRAPERRAGATPEGDAYSLGALLRWCATPQDSIPIEAWTAPLVVKDPALRPPVEVAARALASCAPARSVAVPERSEVVTAVRARAVERTERIAAGRWWRARRAAIRVGAGLAVAAAAVSAMVAVPRVVDAAMSTDGYAAASAGSAGAAAQARSNDDNEQANADRPDPDHAAAELTVQRIEALSNGDGESLRAVVGEGPIAADLARLADELDDGRTRYEGLAVEVKGTELISESTDAATVVVEYAVTDHRVITDDGGVHARGYEHRVGLELMWDGRWIVVNARPVP